MGRCVTIGIAFLLGACAVGETPPPKVPLSKRAATELNARPVS